MSRHQTRPKHEAIVAAVLTDWEAGNLSKEFKVKQRDRGISDAQIERTLKGKASLIGRYTDHGRPRYGFWHLQTQVFVAWQPAEAGFASQLKACFREKDGRTYMRNRRNFQVVRWK